MPFDALILSALAILTAAFVAIKGWKEFVRGEVDKAKEQSVGATAIRGQNEKIDEVLEELKELKRQVKDNAELRDRVNKLDNDFKELLQTSLRYWQERGRL